MEKAWSSLKYILRQIIIFLVLSLVVTSVMDFWRGKDLPKQDLPLIKAVNIQGKVMDLAQLSDDQAVLVYFWGTWCPVCNYVSPAVNFIAQHYPVISVAMTSGDDEKLKRYLTHKDYDFNVINDSDNKISRDWSVQIAPTVMIFKNGQLQYYTAGFTTLPGIWWRMLTA